MKFAELLQLVLRYGPSVIPLVSKLTSAIAAGKSNEPVTEADWAELTRLANQTGADIYARMGIAPPPPK